MLRVVTLDLRDLPEILGDRTIADQLDVVEAHHAVLSEIDRAVAREDIDDRLADRLPHRAAPALIERFGDLSVGVRWGTGREPEGIGRLDACETRSEISHGFLPAFDLSSSPPRPPPPRHSRSPRHHSRNRRRRTPSDDPSASGAPCAHPDRSR